MRFPEENTRVRYIKLGEGNTALDRRCIEEGIAFMHFGTVDQGMFDTCSARDWEGLRERFRTQQAKVPSTATNLTNQFREFVEDTGDVLWFTFYAGKLWWGFLEPELPTQPDPDLGFVRRVAGGWRSGTRTNPDGPHALAIDSLSGRITKTAGFRGTSCGVNGDDARYLIHRINGTPLEEVAVALDAREQLRIALQGVIALLTPQDFELLTEHVFTSAGWRRISSTGKVLEVVDIVLEQPLDTSRRIFAQVKSRTNQQQLEHYIAEFDKRRDLYERMYFVFHTTQGKVTLPEGVDGVALMGPAEIADKVIDAGVVSWVIDKAR